MSHAIIYARFSPRPNADKSESIETQVETCKKYCKREGHRVREVFADRAISGKSEERPGLWDAIDALKRGDVLVAWRPDRLAREVFLAEYIQREVRKKRCRIQYVQGGCNGDTPEQHLMRGILQQFAQYERELTALRTSMAMQRHQRRGKVMSKIPPFGYRKERKEDGTPYLVKDTGEQRLLARIIKMHDDGMADYSIAKTLEDEGVKFRGRARWHTKTLSRILERELANAQDS